MNLPNVISRLSIRTPSLLVVFAAITGLASNQAGASIIGMSTDNMNGTWTYEYTIDNTTGNSAVVGFDLDFDFTPDWNQLDVNRGGDVMVPDANWSASLGGPSLQGFLSLGPSSDVLPGAILQGFSFTSGVAPALVGYQEYHNLPSISGAGFVPGPSGLAAVPEPTSFMIWSLVGLVGAGLSVRKKHRKRKTAVHS